MFEFSLIVLVILHFLFCFVLFRLNSAKLGIFLIVLIALFEFYMAFLLSQ